MRAILICGVALALSSVAHAQSDDVAFDRLLATIPGPMTVADAKPLYQGEERPIRQASNDHSSIIVKEKDGSAEITVIARNITPLRIAGVVANRGNCRVVSVYTLPNYDQNLFPFTVRFGERLVMDVLCQPAEVSVDEGYLGRYTFTVSDEPITQISVHNR